MTCPKCGHGWEKHDQLIKGAGKIAKPEYNPYGYEDLYECSAYMGMGNWCGCEERSRRPILTPPEQPVTPEEEQAAIESIIKAHKEAT